MFFIIFMGVIAVAAVAFFALGILQKKTEDSYGPPHKLISGGLAAFFAIIWVWNSFVVIKPGHSGALVYFGKVQEQTLPEGFHIVNPLLSIKQYSIQTETYTMVGPHKDTDDMDSVNGGAIQVNTSDELIVPMDVTVVYSVNADDVALLRRFFPNHNETLVRTPARTVIRDVGGQFTAKQLYSESREEVGQMMTERLRSRVLGLVRQQAPGSEVSGILIQEVQVRRVTPPSAISNAIEAKLKAEQEALRMEFIIQKERQEAIRKEIEAEGIAKFQTIVSEGIDNNLLQWKGIEATLQLAESENSKVVIVGSGESGLPLILGGNN